jgi:Prohead core protein serine protease
MAKITINKTKVSNTAWGSVNKTTLGRELSNDYADGSASKAVINEMYAVVQGGAFGTDSDGKKVFHQTKGWGPHHVVSGSELVANRGGVIAAGGALAGARQEPSLSSSEMSHAKTHIRRHYRQLKMDVPDNLKEDLNILDQGEPLEELVKGSMEYTLSLVQNAFRSQFPNNYDQGTYYWISDTFSNYVIISASGDDLLPDEYYRVGYTRDGSKFTFDDKENWQVVELSYQPQSRLVESKEDQRFVEEFGGLKIEESTNGGPRPVSAAGITANVLNGNRRRYPGHILEAAVKEAQTHLNESLGQGRVQLLGEAEHPSTKGGRPNLFETVFKWNDINFDGEHILVEGIVLPTSKGRDIQALLENGVNIPISQRAYGKSIIIEEDGEKIEEVTELHITGYDATLTPSDPDAGILETLQESIEMLTPEEIKKFLEEHPELGVSKDQIEELTQSQLKVIGETLEAQLAPEKKDNPPDPSEEEKKAQETLKALTEQIAVNAAVEEATKDLNYGAELNKKFTESVKASKPASPDEVKILVEMRKKEYDAIFASNTLKERGFKGIGQIAPVIEREANVPAYARASYELLESLRKTALRPRRNLSEAKTPNEVFAQLYLEKFDEEHKRQLIREALEFEEAEAVSDLNLPYSVARTVIAEALPELIATSVFDFGIENSSPFRLYYEAFSGETGYTVAIAANDNITCTALDTWYDMAHKRITPGTVVAKDAAETTTYTEGTDYVVDYAGGRFRALTGGGITALDVVHVTAYTYTAIREGESGVIQRGKLSLTYKTIEAAADRLADQITREAIVFSRSQIGWDATARTLANLIRQVRTKIDQGVMYLALSASLMVASNSGGTWTASTDPLSELVEKIGYAKVKIANRYYMPTFVLLSVTNSDILSNSDLFSAAGQRPDTDLNANGYVGRVKGLPCYQSTEMSDSYALVGNRELAMHRVLSTMTIHGPFPTYDVSGGTSKLVAADQYYVEEFNATEAPVPQKGSHVVIA